MTSRNLMAMLALAAVTCVSFSARPAQTEKPRGGSRSVWEGIYTEQQAKRGGPLYASECSTCHGEKLAGREDAPALVGNDFLASWNGLVLDKLFAKIRLTMPKGEPGEVGVQEKADILAYILSVNKFPSGSAELPKESEALKDIRFEVSKPEGKTAGTN